MGIFEDNLSAVKYGFSELHERMIRIGPDKCRTDFKQIENMETLVPTGAIVVETVESDVIRLNSAYDPEHEAAVWVNAQKGIESQNIFVFGLGNGSFARAILRKKGRKSRMVIYEPSAQLFQFAARHYDLTEFFQTPGVRVVIEGLNEDMYSGVMEEMLTVENYESKVFLVCPQFGRLFPESRKRFVDGYLDGVGRIMSNKNTVRRFLHISPYNQLHNLRYLESNTVVPKLARVWEKDVPVIIIGAGPSLQNDIELLKKYHDQAFLFAVDSALPLLLRENVIPDAYICIEADKPLYFFEDERAKKIPLFARINTTHKLLDMHEGVKVFGYDDGFPEMVYEKYQVPVSHFRYGGNGATSFFAICRELGVKNVILSGQDMAYAADHTSHAGGRDEGYTEEERFVYEANQGGMVQSRQDWHRFIKWYENAIPVCRFDHVINIAPLGAKIRGTEYMPLEKALEQYGKNHSSVEKLAADSEKTFEGGKDFLLKPFYEQCMDELARIKECVEQNPRNEKRKEPGVYKLLELYEIADAEEDFRKSQSDGLEKISGFLQDCIKEGP